MSIDWNEVLVRRQAAEGTARVIPVQPQADPPPGVAEPPSPAPTPPSKKRQFLPQGFTIATTTSRTFIAADLPEYWIVQVGAVVNGEVTIFEGDRVIGEPMAIIGPRGYAKLPATTDRITLLASAAGNPTGVVIACSGHDVQIAYGSS